MYNNSTYFSHFTPSEGVRMRLLKAFLTVIFLFSAILIVSAQDSDYLNRLEKEAESGNLKSQEYLGFIYQGGSTGHIGSEVPKDLLKAKFWLEKATESGSAVAPNQLAEFYVQGLGVEENLEEAEKLMIIAASRGNKDAQYSLGHIKTKGLQGFKPDIIRGLAWFIIAANENTGVETGASPNIPFQASAALEMSKAGVPADVIDQAEKLAIQVQQLIIENISEQR